MISPYRINPNNAKRRPKKVKTEDNGELTRPLLTSNNKKTRSKNVLTAGSAQKENIEINEHYLDKILKNNNT